jgi:hypothetical protein
MFFNYNDSIVNKYETLIPLIECVFSVGLISVSDTNPILRYAIRLNHFHFLNCYQCLCVSVVPSIYVCACINASFFFVLHVCACFNVVILNNIRQQPIIIETLTSLSSDNLPLPTLPLDHVEEIFCGQVNLHLGTRSK